MRLYYNNIMKKILVVSLGCVKNTVDSETIIGFLEKNNFEMVTSPLEADAIIINTCGFIEAAKKESLDTIFSYAKYDKKLIVVGCLVERYFIELSADLKDVVDLFIPIREYKNLSRYIKELFDDEIVFEYNPYYRVLSTPSYSAYLKISDGCNHFCSYCAIPLIRKRFASVPKEELLKEAKRLASLGIKELIIVSQDTTNYGSDLYKDYGISELLQDIINLNCFISIRLLYLYAYEVDDKLIQLFKNNQDVLLPYFDLPIQHCSDRLLKSMNRRDSKIGIYNLISHIRKEIPQAIVRTTIIVGFAGETEEDFIELCDFIKDIKFDHLGAFTYSIEEGTQGAKLPNQIPQKIKNARLKELLKLQMSISYDVNKKHIGEKMKGIIIGFNKNSEGILRSYFNAPDDVDGAIYFKVNKEHKIGDVVDIVIESNTAYDLYGKEV